MTSDAVRVRLNEWLADPHASDAQRRLARLRLDQLDGAAPPLEDGPPAVTVTEGLVRRVKSCRHWSPGASCCAGWFCRHPDREGPVSIVDDCAACPELPADPADPADAPTTVHPRG